jgi:hypothetical protein
MDLCLLIGLSGIRATAPTHTIALLRLADRPRFYGLFCKHVVDVLNDLQTEKTYMMTDVAPYAVTHINTVLGVFATAKWN